MMRQPNQAAAARSQFFLRLMGTAAAMALCAGALQAQDSTSSQNTGASFFDLGTLVISARRIDEELQDAPIAVTVQTEEDFSFGKVDDLSDLANRAPNAISFDANGQTFVIRGVGSQSVQGINSQVGVGLFLDEVYIGRPEGAPQFLFDLEQTEIVRGPQSSIYGRNTIGGAVNLVTRKPSNARGGDLELSYGTNGTARTKLGFDIPLLEDGKWLSRAALSYTNSPDGITNLSTGENDLGLKALNGRFTVTGELGERTNLTFAVDFEKVDDQSKGGWSLLDLAFNKQSNLDFPGRRKDDRAGAMLRVEHDFDRFWLQSTTAVRGFDQDLILDGDFTSGPYDPSVGFFELQQGRAQEHRQFTQEFRFGSYNQSDRTAGDISWNAGLFFMAESFDGYEFYELASVAADRTSRNALKSDARALSAFANVSYQANDRFAMHGGLRYTYEKTQADVNVMSESGTFFYGPAQSGSTSVTSENFSPEVGFDYRFSDDTLAFARVSTGFKSGGIAQFFDATGNVNTYKPETAISYEAGLKTKIFDGRAALDVTLFRTDWRDQQANVFINDFQRVTANASAALSQGLELGFDSQLTDTLRLRANYGYLDAKFSDFRYTYFSAGTGDDVTIDFNGNPIPLAPRHSASLSLDWETPLANQATLLASGTYTYRDSYTFDPQANYRQPASHLLDASLTYQKDTWAATVWAKNLLDEDYLTNYFLFGGSDYGIAGSGRTVGISFSTEW